MIAALKQLQADRARRRMWLGQLEFLNGLLEVSVADGNSSKFPVAFLNQKDPEWILATSNATRKRFQWKYLVEFFWPQYLRQ